MGNKVAVIHDWLNGMRGGEKVLEEILDLIPEADIFTLFLDRGKISEKILKHNIFVSSLNKKKFIKKRYKYFLPLFPSSIEEFDLNGYDLIVSSSHCVAKGVIPPPGSRHVSYIHSPMRYAWDQYYSYFGNVKGLKKFYIKRKISYLRNWDVSSSSRVDLFIANSEFVKERIRRYYNRESVVVHPPVDVDGFTLSEKPSSDYYLTVSALVPYKRVDIIIDAFNKTQERLIIVGKGSEEKRLKRMADKNIEFKKDLSENELRELYGNAKAFVFAGIEDFGISFVEAISSGTPVISFNRGGVVDIIDEKNGVLYDEQNCNSLISAIESSEKMRFNREEIRESALRFSKKNFRKNFVKYLESLK